MHILEAVGNARQAIDMFLQEYIQQHNENPEMYPLELSEDNAGVWLEFITEAIINFKGD